MLFFDLFISLVLLIIGITILSNLIFFPRLQVGRVEDQPLVSVLIPARNESAVISQIVAQVLAQTYTNIQLIVLDDGSSDGTADLAVQAASMDARFRLLCGEVLPPGWLGKNWACHQLAQAASGELLLFLDADVQLQPAALAALVAYLKHERAGLLTVWPTQITASWGERLLVPLIAFAIIGYLPVLPVHHAPWPTFAAANGQCLLFTRLAYQQSGGHAAVRGSVIEDIALARQVKAAYNPKISYPLSRDTIEKSNLVTPLRMVDGNRLVSCQMYPGGWSQIKDGFAKNILAGHANNIPFLIFSMIFHWLVFIIPWIWLVLGGGWWAVGLGFAGLLLRALTAAFTHQRTFDALTFPLSVVLMSFISVKAIIWHYTGTATWKGRQLKIEEY